MMPTCGAGCSAIETAAFSRLPLAKSTKRVMSRLTLRPIDASKASKTDVTALPPCLIYVTYIYEKRSRQDGRRDFGKHEKNRRKTFVFTKFQVISFNYEWIEYTV